MPGLCQGKRGMILVANLAERGFSTGGRLRICRAGFIGFSTAKTPIARNAGGRDFER